MVEIIQNFDTSHFFQIIGQSSENIKTYYRYLFSVKLDVIDNEFVFLMFIHKLQDLIQFLQINRNDKLASTHLSEEENLKIRMRVELFLQDYDKYWSQSRFKHILDFNIDLLKMKLLPSGSTEQTKMRQDLFTRIVQTTRRDTTEVFQTLVILKSLNPLKVNPTLQDKFQEYYDQIFDKIIYDQTLHLYLGIKLLKGKIDEGFQILINIFEDIKNYEDDRGMDFYIIIDDCYQNFIQKIPKEILLDKYFQFFHNNYDIPVQCNGMIMIIYLQIKDLLSYQQKIKILYRLSCNNHLIRRFESISSKIHLIQEAIHLNLYPNNKKLRLLLKRRDQQVLKHDIEKGQNWFEFTLRLISKKIKHEDVKLNLLQKMDNYRKMNF